MIKRFFLLSFLAIVMASFLSACSETKVDPYATVSLKQATRGTVISKEFKYKLVKPEIIALHRNLGLIREGNLVEFVVARSLEDKISDKLDGYYEFNVVKKFSPYVHFKVVKFATETDTVFPAQAGAITYPRITTMEEYGVDAFEDYDVNTIAWNATSVLKKLVEKRMKIHARISMEQQEGKKYYVIHGDKAKLRVAETNDGTGLMLKLFAENNYWFDGGVTFTEVESFGERRKNHFAGTVQINWVMYGDQLVSG